MKLNILHKMLFLCKFKNTAAFLTRRAPSTIAQRILSLRRIKKTESPSGNSVFHRARDGDRTRDPHLGKVVLHR